MSSQTFFTISAVVALAVLAIIAISYIFVKLKLPRDAEDRWNSSNRGEFDEKPDRRDQGE